MVVGIEGLVAGGVLIVAVSIVVVLVAAVVFAVQGTARRKTQEYALEKM